MLVTMSMSERMWAGTQRFDGDTKFVSIRVQDGEGGELNLYVDPKNVGKAMDMLQRVLDELGEMPRFDSDHASPIVPATIAAPQAIDGGEDCPF